LVEANWLEGKPPKEIAKEVTHKVKAHTKNEEGKIDIEITVEEFQLLEQDLLELFSVIASDPNYRDGVSRMMDLGEMLYEESEEVNQKTEAATNMTHTKKLAEETKDLVAEFTGHDALDRFTNSSRTLAKRLREDEETRSYLKELKAYILETRDPQQVKTEEFKLRSKELLERGRLLMNKLRYQSEVTEFLDSADKLIENLKNDEFVASLRERAGILVDDLTYEDEKGNKQLDTQLLSNIRKVIVPVLADALKYIPIPRISDSNGKRDYVIENVVLCGYDVIPDHIYVHLESDSWVSLRELETEKSRTRLVLSLRNIRTEIKDVQFYFNRKVFPQIEDSGRVTVRIGGKGANLTITFRVDQQPGEANARFTGGRVDFSIDNLDIEFDRSTLKHDVLLPMLTGLFKQQIIRNIERSVEKNLGGIVNDIGKRLSDALVGNRFTRQLERISDTVKKGEFGRRFQKRQEKLE